MALTTGILVSVGFAFSYAKFSTLLGGLHAANAALYLGAYLYFYYKPDPVVVTRGCCVAAITLTWVVNFAFGGMLSLTIA